VAAGLSRLTSHHPGAAPVSHAARSTWIVRVDRGGRPHMSDRYPRGGRGIGATLNCCNSPLDGAADASVADNWIDQAPSAMHRARLEAVRREWLDAASRFRIALDRLRPLGATVLPVMETLPDDTIALRFPIAAPGASGLLVPVPAQDRPAIETGMRLIDRALSAVRDTQPDRITHGGPPDFLNAGMLALSLSDLAAGVPEGSDLDKAALYLAMIQSGLQLTGDAFETVRLIQQIVNAPSRMAIGRLARVGGLLQGTMEGVAAVAQAASVAMDAAQLVRARSAARHGLSRSSGEVGTAGMGLGLDIAGLSLAGVSVVATVVGSSAVAVAAGGLGVPLSGLTVALMGLRNAIVSEEDRLIHHLEPLHRIDQSYDQPLRALPLTTSPAGPALLTAVGWAPVRRIDFQKGLVTFADATLRASAVRRDSLYWQFGSDRLHEAWVLDGADRQYDAARTGTALSLWTLMGKPGRSSRPEVPMSAALSDPAHILLLLTSPAMDIANDSYSASRAGGDFSLLGDELVVRMERNSQLDFVGDFVTSSSFARSADDWRYVYRPNILEVQLDQHTRVMTLPDRHALEDAAFTIGVQERGLTIKPFHQSAVPVRLIGGGGDYVVVLAPEGPARGPLCITPSDSPHESWTFALKGALSQAKVTLEFSPTVRGDFSLNGQPVSVTQAGGSHLRLADPDLAGLSVIIDANRVGAALNLDLGEWQDDLDPGHVLKEATRHFMPSPSLAELLFPLETQVGFDAAEPVMLSATVAGSEGVTGYVDGSSSFAVLKGADRVLIHHPADGARARAWTHTAVNPRHHVVTIDDSGLPVIAARSGGLYLAPPRFAYDLEERRFVLASLTLTEEGMFALGRWMRDHPDWTLKGLRAFVVDGLADGVDLTGPSGTDPTPLLRIYADSRPPEVTSATAADVHLRLWRSLDQLRQSIPGSEGASVPLDAPLIRCLDIAGFPLGLLGRGGRTPPGSVTHADLALLQQWAVLKLSAAAEVSAHEAGERQLLGSLTALTVGRRTALVALLRDLIALRADPHRPPDAACAERQAQDLPHGATARCAQRSPVALGATPDASLAFAQRVRDAGIDLRIATRNRVQGLLIARLDGRGDHYCVPVVVVEAIILEVHQGVARDLFAR
ncbi:MAG: TcdA/TcdB pore-forming domain-containing protein, partial [Burkholderiaceae bacterium]